MFEVTTLTPSETLSEDRDTPSIGDRLAREQEAVDGYRAGRLSRFQVQVLLGFDNRFDTEDWLGRQGVASNYETKDLEDDRRTLDRLFPG